MYIFYIIVNNIYGDKMENNGLLKKVKTKKNELCGDCYYNGNCIISSKSCKYLKNEKEKKKQILNK